MKETIEEKEKEIEVNSFFEVVDYFRIGPEFFRALVAILGILLNASPPFPVVDEGNDDAHAGSICDCEDSIEGSKGCFIKLTRFLYMTGNRVWAGLTAD